MSSLECELTCLSLTMLPPETVTSGDEYLNRLWAATQGEHCNFFKEKNSVVSAR
jgi:hypothetical protein